MSSSDKNREEDGEGTKTEIRKVEMKIPFPFMRKSEILSMLQKFPESWFFRNLIFAKQDKTRQMFSRKSAKMSSKYFYKNGRFASHVDDNFCLFCKKLKEKSTIVNFR
jgi:hypothetical protein